VVVIDDSNPYLDDAKIVSGRIAPQVTVTRILTDPRHTDSGARRMLLARTFVSVSAVAIAAMAGIVFLTSDSFASLGDSLNDVEQSETLHLQIVRNGETADVWMRKSEGTQSLDIRWQTVGKQSYVIAKGSRLWRIDEASNTARPESNPWRNEKTNQIDVLAMIGLSENSAKLRKARAIGKQVVDGVECHVFRTVVRIKNRELLVKAFTDAQTKQLRSIACWANNAKPNALPIAELKLIARNVPVDEDKFIVAKSLTEDGRIGKIVDRQGVVTLKPLNAKRWTPVVRSIVVKPGDWIRTDRRGANAVAVTMEAGHRVTLGPATLIEFTSFDSITIHNGEVQVASAKKPQAVLNLLGPTKQQIQFERKNSGVYRVVADGQLRKLNGNPKWLQGFEGTSANESLGSLIANVRDGGGDSLQLSIGYHKVNVEIRDQIARTTIEESFVNHTNQRLEGVFHFPLPQDASISGFGMWINNELVEADVVEKQRARQIYEAILRQKKDPALLEWTGGNIFKARVFPIEPHSEKRIRIVYTQVLPMRANRYRYSYGLRSEMLQTTPLRELVVNVTVNSTLPIKDIRCPTHQTRNQVTQHSARLEFEESDYTPTRDFEVVCEVDARQSDVVVIPHRRGDDGYFMVQLTPPSAAGNWQRELLPDGDPLELLLVCDTSGSMDSQNRELQSEFVSTVLASLGDADRFNVAVTDVDCTWMFDKPVAAREKSVALVQQRLNDRPSLGWTDLDRTFASIKKRAGKNSHVIYIGDGVVSARDADPQAFVARLETMYDSNTRGTFHAVSVGSSFESVVLRSIARLGGGSVRSIDGEQTPQRVALELLNEIAQPGLRDITVDFRDVQVAAVYPDRLPNLAAGSQQILIGRYLPTGKNQTGEIVVTGKRAGKTVKYAAKLDLVDAERGNSFVPRLWARSHLDHLLDQGSNAVIKDEIIGLSEEFHIITPYTSLLVLESDAQREEFGVKRRYEMRDGERFFADGRDNANFELRQQQMKAAGDWRIGLRRRILQHLTTLGRDPRLFQQHSNFGQFAEQLARETSESNGLSFVIQQTQQQSSGSMSGPVGGVDISSLLGEFDVTFTACAPFVGGGGGGEVYGQPIDFVSGPGDSNGPANISGLASTEFDGRSSDARAQEFLEFDRPERVGLVDFEQLLSKSSGSLRASSDKSRFLTQFNRPSSAMAGERGLFGPGYYQRSQSIRWVSEIFPQLPARPSEPTKPKRSKWPAEAVEISRSLLRGPKLAKLKGGLEVVRETNSFDPAWKRNSGVSSVFELYSTSRFLQRPVNTAAATIVSWADKSERGVLNASFLLGQTRKSYSEDFSTCKVGVGSYVHSLLHVDLHDYDVEITEEEVGAVTLVCSNPAYPDGPKRIFEVDTTRNVIVEDRSERDGKVVTKTTYGDFVEAGGIHWPTKIEVFNDKGQVIIRTTQKVTLHDEKKYTARFDKELDVLNRCQILKHPLPSVSAAETAAAKGSADFEDRMILMLRAALVQKWDTVFTHFSEIEKLTPGKSGIEWMNATVLASAGEKEEARQAWIKLAEQLLAQKSDDVYLASHLITKIRSVSDANEAMAVVDRLKPIFERLSLDRWNEHRRSLFEQLGKTDKALELAKSQALSVPWDANRQTRFARLSHRVGQFDTAFQWLRDRFDGDEPWLVYQKKQFRQTYYDLLQQQGRSNEAVKFMEKCIALDFAEQYEFGRYLVSFIHANRATEANAIALKWMQAGQVEEELKGRALQQLNAAVDYATGNRVGMYVYEMDDMWHADLDKLARFFMNHEHNWNIATNVMWHHNFYNSDKVDELRKVFAKQLTERVAEFDARHISAVVSIVSSHDILTKDEWLPIVDTIFKKRAQAKKDNARDQLGSTILSIYQQQFADNKLLPFMRQRIADAIKHKRLDRAASLSTELFNVLMSKPWSEEIENELFGLIEKLSSSESAASRLASSVAVLHRVVDATIKGRVEADRIKFQDTGNPEKLKRFELREKYASFAKSAREAIAKRLAQEAKTRKGALAAWCRLERATLDIRLERNLKDVAAECWKLLENLPAHTAEFNADDAETAEIREKRLHHALEFLQRERAITALMNLAARRSASEKSVARLLAFVDFNIKVGGAAAHEWKMRRYQMLIALDRPDELTASLRKWVAQDNNASHWRRSLARLHAERGQFADAIQLVQANERESVLSPGDHALMARWQLVLDDREAYIQSRIETLKAVEEWQLNNWINQTMQAWHGYNNRPIPSELDENVLFAFQALFEKSANPSSYIYTLRQSYAACRDFRLLKMVPDAVLGRTPQQVYAFLQNLNSNLLSEVRNESTADEIMARINELRESRQLTAMDERALDLLECLVERRSADVLNQPGPHGTAAAAALKRAFKHELADGEIRQMAAFLDSLGRLKQQPLIDEQLRQLRDLLGRTKPGTDDHIHVSWHLANTLFWQYNKRADGMTMMQAAIRAYEKTHVDGWPKHAEGPINGFIGFFEALGQVSSGEQFIRKHIANPANEGQRFWFKKRLNRLYRFALSTHARVSLGSEAQLLQKTIALMVAQASEEPNDDYRYSVLSLIPDIFDTAHREKVPTASAQYQTYAFEQMPPVLKLLKNNYESVVRKTSVSVKTRLGVKKGLEFLIGVVENYPDRFAYTYYSAWRNHASTLGDWRTKVEESQALGSLSGRLLAIVIKELKRDMRMGKFSSRYIYGHNGYQRFWAAKKTQFKKAAEEVLQQHEDSTRIAVRVATYLHGELRYRSRAIEILSIKHSAKKLNASQQTVLIRWLHAAGKYGETIAMLEPLVESYPDRASYRVFLITAYARSNRPTQAEDLIVSSDKYFRAGGRWTESNIAALAKCLFEIRRHKRAIAYYKELIPLHKRKHRNQGLRSYSLMDYYRKLSLAHSALGQTLKAMDAATSAVLLWSKADSSRNSAISNVQHILSAAKDLDDYIAHLDKEAEANGSDSPLLRRLCAEALAAHGKPEAAVKQFKLALQFDPTNQPARIGLIKLLDRLDRKDEALVQLLLRIDIERHNLDLYTDLINRTKDDAAWSERAFTSIIESAPTEHLHHQKAAELRQGQNRWSDAIVHWQQVAKHQAFEPTGLLGLAKAQIHEKKWDAAKATVEKLNATEWPSRFSNLQNQVRNLESRLE
jgi:hypothetical protein